MRAITATCGSARVTTGSTRLEGDAPAADRQPGERQAEEDLQHRRDDEVRDREPDRAEADDGVVDGAVLPEGGDGAERAADRDGERQRQRAERHRDRQPAREQLGDGEVAEIEGRPEIPAHERREVEPVLLGKRQVEAVDAAQVLHDLRLERLLEVEGTAGRDADEEEGDRDDQEQRRDRGEETAEDEEEHGLRIVIAGARRQPVRSRRTPRRELAPGSKHSHTGLWSMSPSSRPSALPRAERRCAHGFSDRNRVALAPRRFGTQPSSFEETRFLFE